MPDLDDDVRLLADECAAEARHFVETAVEVASGAAPESAIPLLLLATSQVQLMGARLGAIADIVLTERFEAEEEAEGCAEALCEADPDELSVLSWSSPEPPQALRASSAARESALRARGRVRVDMRSLLLRCRGSEPTWSGPL